MADRTGQRLGNYRLTQLLGRGGFAEVYLGEHVRLGTHAAVKVLYTLLASPEEVESFEKEARTIAHLRHQHIVRVFDFDVIDDTPFLVMNYAPNGALRKLHPRRTKLSFSLILTFAQSFAKHQAMQSRRTKLSFSIILTYIKQTADALQYAHGQRLIHRDIKPENILLGQNNELLLSDFNIATISQSSRYEGKQDMAGTIAYMAPEQVQGKPRPASDQYALGIVVYEWLSGERPFHGSFTEIAAQHVLTPPPSLHEKVPDLSPSVEQVVMTALAKDPKARFATIHAFANALEQAHLAEQALSFAPTILATPKKPASPQPAIEVAPGSSLPAVSSPPPPQSIVVSLPQDTVLLTYRGHSGSANVVTWSPDGRCIASGSSDETVQVWEAVTGKPLFTYRGHPNLVRAVAWSPDGTRIASASSDSMVQVWNAADGSHIYTYHGHSDIVNAVAWSPNGTRIASASSDKTVQVWLPV